jgi:HK97 family phage portal protein
VAVTEENSLASAAVYACVRVLAETLASLPLMVYERLPDGGRRRAPEHPLYELLHMAPNPEMTTFELRETLMGHLSLWGNGYAQVQWNNGGRVMALWPLRPDQVTVTRRGGRLVYLVKAPGQAAVELAAEEVLHVRGMGGNGLTGYSPIRMAREAIGLGLAAQEYGARFFANDATPGGLLMHPGVLGEDGTRNVQESWEERHQGLGNSHRVTVLEEGMTYQMIGIPPEDAQFLETRKYQRSEIASIFRVPPHLIQDLERATFSNIEHQSIAFSIHTIRPWVVRWEQALMRVLLSPAERRRYFVAFVIDGLLRGDLTSRSAAYAVAIGNGWMSRNEVRSLENLNPFEGGDEFLLPLNMAVQGEMPPQEGGAGGAPAGLPEPRSAVAETRGRRSAGERRRLADRHRPLYRETVARVLRREANDVGAAARRLLEKRGRGEFEQWLEEFYREHQAFVLEQVRPVAETYAGGVAREAGDEIEEGEPAEDVLSRWVEAYVAAFAARLAAQQQDRVRQALAAEDPAAALEDELSTWRETRADDVAAEEVVRLGNAVAVFVYGFFGVAYLRWVSSGKETCPYCRALNGKVVGIRESFLGAGDEFQPEGAARPLLVSRRVGHPPAHKGCDCLIVAA